MLLVYAYFLANSCILALGFYYLSRQIRGIPIVTMNGGNVPNWIPLFCMLFGTLGLLATIPLIFSNNPSWLTDKIFHFVSWLLARFVVAE